MKSRTIWIIVSIVILLAVLYWGSQTNWWGLKKTTSTSQMTPAQASVRQVPAGMQRCCAEYGTNGECKVWEDRAIGRPCGGATA